MRFIRPRTKILTILQAALAKDVKKELEATLDLLSGKSKGGKGKAPRGAERRKMWEEVRALRKESVCSIVSFFRLSDAYSEQI